MARIKIGKTSHAKHKKLLSQTKGFRGTKSKLIKVAKEAALHAGQYAYHGRKLRKRDFRTRWILTISEATKPLGLSYSRFMHGLKTAKIDLNRKVLAEMVVSDPESFKQLVDKVHKSN